MDERPLIEAKLKELERCLLEPGWRGSGRLAELLADDFVEFGSSGRVLNKKQVVDALRVEPPVEWVAQQVKVQLLDRDVALVIDEARDVAHAQVNTLRSSVWRRSDGHWRIVFHQGTRRPSPT